jgi:hypothetical protein
MPDSININMIDPSGAAWFMARLDCESTLASSCRNTLKILKTIRPVTRAFTVMDMT